MHNQSWASSASSWPAPALSTNRMHQPASKRCWSREVWPPSSRLSLQKTLTQIFWCSFWKICASFWRSRRTSMPSELSIGWFTFLRRKSNSSLTLWARFWQSSFSTQLKMKTTKVQTTSTSCSRQPHWQWSSWGQTPKSSTSSKHFSRHPWISSSRTTKPIWWATHSKFTHSSWQAPRQIVNFTRHWRSPSFRINRTGTKAWSTWFRRWDNSWCPWFASFLIMSNSMVQPLAKLQSIWWAQISGWSRLVSR